MDSQELEPGREVSSTLAGSVTPFGKQK